MAKKNSAMKKLVAAAAMLGVSTTMLSGATYAWFTMSREVEVQNIKLTATTPEDMQIAIGTIGSTNTAVSESETYTLAGSTGVLVHSGNVVTAPREEGTAYDELDWSNTADISKYYTFGRLMPASSTDGVNVFFTPDANGVGRTIKDTAAFYQAASGSTVVNASMASGSTAMATAHVNTTNGGDSDWVSTSGTAGGYTTATAWNATGDDGYYVDIPVWLRTSNSAETNVYVTAYVTKGANTTDTDEDDVLYQAVRVAILKADGTADGGCLTLKDASASGATATYFSTTAQAATNILDSDNYNTRASGTGINAVNSDGVGSWTTITQNNGSVSLGTLNPGTGTGYGTSTKFIIRVWLEGEDGDCWNENAGQDWNISLKFMKEALPAS